MLAQSQIFAGVSNVAYGLRPLSKDSALIAYMQLCRLQALNSTPQLESADRIRKLVAGAERCEKEFKPGNSRKACIARVLPLDPRSLPRGA